MKRYLPGGWEVRFASSQSPLGQLGIESGDIILDDAIAQIPTPESRQRLTRLLWAIRR